MEEVSGCAKSVFIQPARDLAGETGIRHQAEAWHTRHAGGRGPGLTYNQTRIRSRRCWIYSSCPGARDGGVQTLVIGEAREWETVEYVADAVSEGKQKSLIILGHIPSEQAGMEECTRWLKTFVTGVPIQFVPAREPFWSPKP